MKTTKLSKNFAALCLSVAAFCAAQDGFAQTLAPAWQNSYTEAPTSEFYLCHPGQNKFVTNNTALVDAKNATSWTISGNRLVTNGKQLKGTYTNLYVSKIYTVSFADAGTDFTLEYVNEAWGMFCVLNKLNSYLTANGNNLAYKTNGATYDWYFVSPAQYNNHLALEAYNTQNNSAKTYENNVPAAYWNQIAANVNVANYLAGNNNFADFALETDQSSVINEKSGALQAWLVNAPDIKTAYVAAKVILDTANGYLEDAVEGDNKTALANAIETATTTIEAATTAEVITNATTALNSAIDIYKASSRGQFVDGLGNAISVAENFTPHFAFLDPAIETARTAMGNDELSANELIDAKSVLEGVVKQAQAIVESDEYVSYLGYIQLIRDNIAKAADAGYTGYDVTTCNNAIATAETALLGVNSKVDFFKDKDKKDDPNKIGDNLRAAADNAAGDVARYAYAEAVVAQAAKIGYTAEVAPLRAASVADLPALIEGIRTSATTGINNFIDNYESEDPIDMSIFIKNNSFELGNADGWTIINKDGDTGVKLANPDYLSLGIDGGFLYNTWEHGSTKLGGDYYRGYGIYQKLSGLPNGKYKLEALFTSAPENKTYLTVDENVANLGSVTQLTRVGEGVTSANGESELVEASYEFNVTNGTVTIGAIGENRQSSLVNYNTWFRADNFRLSLISLKTVELADDAETYAYEEGSIRRVKVTRTIQPGQWTTLCLPMNCAIPQYVTLYEVNKDKETKVDEHVSIVVEASKDKTILAGKPYIVNYPATHKEGILAWERDEENPTITEFTASAVELATEPKTVGAYIPFTGLFSATDLNAGDIYVSTSTDASAAAVYKELSETAANKQMKGFRAYFKVTDGASSNVRFITDEVITSIMQAIEEQQVANGTYDLSGRKAATLQKGTYVIDGKKVIIK